MFELRGVTNKVCAELFVTLQKAIPKSIKSCEKKQKFIFYFCICASWQHSVKKEYRKWIEKFFSPVLKDWI